MVQAASKKNADVVKMPAKKIIKKRKQEIRNLYKQLNNVLPCFEDRVCGAEVVLKAVQYIDQMHRRVAAERGFKALQQIQNNAKKIALKQLMMIKAEQNFNKIQSEDSEGSLST